MILWLLRVVTALSWPDLDRQNGLVMTRYNSKTPTSPYRRIINTPEFRFPPFTQPEAVDTTILILGSLLPLSNATKISFLVTGSASDVRFLFDGNPVLESSNEFVVYPNKYHSMEITGRVGSEDTERNLSVLMKYNFERDFRQFRDEELFTFSNSNCRESYYGTDCSQHCSDDQCGHNGICIDGMTGTGECVCMSNYFGPKCSNLCRSETTCSDHGICTSNGKCLCDLGYGSEDCSESLDINRGSRALTGIVFYSFCSIAFIITSIVQFCKMEKSNPIACMMLFVFNALNLASAVLTITSKQNTKLSDFLMLLSIAPMAYVIQRGILLIMDQFKATSPDFRFQIVHWFLYIIPVLIAVCSAAFCWAFQNLKFWLVVIPFVTCSIWTFVFSLVALYNNMKDPFGKMDELFPNLALGLRRSRKYLAISATFFIPMTISVCYNVHTTKPMLGFSLCMYYVMIVLEVVCMSTLGLSSDTILSDLFDTNGEESDAQFVPMGIASVTDVDEDQYSTALMAPMYSMCPSVYLKTAEQRFQDPGCFDTALKVIGVCMIVITISLTTAIASIQPSKVTWIFNELKVENIDGNGFMRVYPNITLQNSMNIEMEMNVAAFEFFYGNISLGKAKVEAEKVPSKSGITMVPVIPLNMTKVLTNYVPADGVLGLEIVAEAQPTAMGFFNYRSMANCVQGIKVVPDVDVVGRKGKCVATLAETLFQFN